MIRSLSDCPSLRRPGPVNLGAAALRFARWTSHSICASALVISRTVVTTTRSIFGVFVDPKARALTLDPPLLVLIRAVGGRCRIRFIQGGENARRLWADEIVVGTITDPRDPNSGMDAIRLWHRIFLLCCRSVGQLTTSCRSNGRAHRAGSGSALGEAFARGAHPRLILYGKPACASAEVVWKSGGTRSSPSSKYNSLLTST